MFATQNPQNGTRSIRKINLSLSLNLLLSGGLCSLCASKPRNKQKQRMYMRKVYVFFSSLAVSSLVSVLFLPAHLRVVCRLRFSTTFFFLIAIVVAQLHTFRIFRIGSSGTFSVFLFAIVMSRVRSSTLWCTAAAHDII